MPGSCATVGRPLCSKPNLSSLAHEHVAHLLRPLKVSIATAQFRQFDLEVRVGVHLEVRKCVRAQVRILEVLSSVSAQLGS